jgi:DNA-binding transcriptional ArsR family regulator
MIEFELAHADLARMRFAHSPIRELVASLRTLQDPTRQQMYRQWLSAVSGQLGRLDLALLTALAPSGRLMPDFVMPRPTGLQGALGDELDAVAATPPEYVRAELEVVYPQGQLPAALRGLYADPAAHLPAVAGQLRAYWQVAVQPVWQRLKALCMADIGYRMERFAHGGIACVLDGLHREVSLDGDRLRIDKPHHCLHRVDLHGAGVVLVPCAFSWPTLLVTCCGSDQPLLSYPPRGVAQLWEAPAELPNPLGALIGTTRAALLAVLGLPKTTTQLAGQLGVRPSTVSQHLQILKQTALVDARRRGRMVLYQRTAAATALLAATQPDAPADHQ